MSIELPVTTYHRRDMTDNCDESDVKPEQTNKQTYLTHGYHIRAYRQKQTMQMKDVVTKQSNGELNELNSLTIIM